MKLSGEISTNNGEVSARISTELSFLVLYFANTLPRNGVKVCKSDRCREELSNEHLVAKIGFDTAENEPFEVC